MLRRIYKSWGIGRNRTATSTSTIVPVLIGNLGSTRRAQVGSGGKVELPSGTVLEWWVRSGDRWHVPSLDVTIRDWMLDNTPVVRSALRVPGGDVTGSVYSTVQGTREVIAMVLENATKAPLAAGLVVRSGSGRPIRLEGTTIFDGDVPVAYLPAAPADVMVGPLEPLFADAEVNRTVLSPAGTDELLHAHEAMFVVPLLHQSSVRFAALLGVSSALATASTPVLSALPDPAMVARGWALQAGNTAQIDGDQRRANDLKGLATSLLLWVDGVADRPWLERGAIAHGLVRIGAFDEALRAVDGVDDLQARNGSLGTTKDDVFATAHILAAVVTVARYLPDIAFGTAIVPLVAGALEFLHRSAKRSPAEVAATSGVFVAAARLLDRVDETRAARHAREAWVTAGKSWPLARALESPLPAISSGASLVPGDPARLSNAVVTAVNGLANESADGSIEVFSGWSARDLAGQTVALHNVDTPIGKVSAALRWHGARPALLWEIASAPADNIILRCSVLDPQWSSSQRVGEALLRAPELDAYPS
jgi:hypothetical protein